MGYNSDMPIRVLPPDVVSRIAAGEVVQRPASVVKELVENSIDAGATRIAVEVQRGGLELIRVTDNGCGIPADEVELAFHRYATSKISGLEDALKVRTLGFRGEALPSIAAVSWLTMVTRPAHQEVGIAIRLEGGRVVAMAHSPATVGTVVTVRSLFQNVPARLKWLRSPASEAAQIALVLGNIALAYPEIAFSLVSDGRLVFSTEGNGDLLGVIATLYGWEAAEAMVPLRSAQGTVDVEIEGYVSLPRYHRPNRQQMALFVNRRWVMHRALLATVAEAYRTLLMVGRHPAAVINLRLDPARVDVNVHPSKMEVRLANEAEVCSALHGAIRRALQDQEEREASPAPSVSLPQIRAQQPMGRQMELEMPHEVPDFGQFPKLRVVGQVAGTYIVAEGPSGMYLIDQHAAHERVLYERFAEQMQASRPEVQPLMEPLVVELSSAEAALVPEATAALERMGFQLEPFGGNTVAVRAVPAVMPAEDLAGRLREFLAEVLGGGLQRLQERAAISLACHSAIRAGRVLRHEEMERLVADLLRCRMPRTCAHGRPTMLELHQSLLERQFGRR
jgi:DNA mismatch repair protein MutL